MRTPILALTVALSALVAVGAHADTKVGVTAAVNPQAIGQPPTEPERVLMVGTDNFANEKISTGPAGQVQLLFVDGTSLAVGPDANVTIDEYVYNPNTKTGKLAISASQGLLKLVGGAISKNSEITVTTPTMTAGIRGGIATINSRPGQQSSAAFLFGQAMRVTAAGSTQTATRAGFQIVVPAGGPPQPPTRMTAADVQAASGALQARQRQAAGGASGNAEAREDSALGQSNVASATGSNQAPSLLSQAGGIQTQFSNQQLFNPNTNLAIQQAVIGPTTQLARGAAEGNSSSLTGMPLFGRFYSDQIFSAFNSQNGTATLNSGNNGPITFTVSGTGNNRTITFILPIGGGLTQQFTLPFVFGTDFSTGNIALNGGRGTINGTVQVAADGQFFVVYGSYTPGAGFNCGQQHDCKFGLFGGVPTTTLPQSGYSTYQLQNFDNTYPFLNRNSLPLGTSSPMYVVWSPVTNPTLANGNGQRASFLQGSIFISGTGANQRSGMGGVTGAFFKEANSTVGAAGGMVWQTRDGATSVTTRYGSGIASAQIVAGNALGNAVYGPDGKYIVLVPDQMTANVGGDDTRQTGAVTEVPFNASQPSSDPGFFVTVGRHQGVVSATSAGRNTQQYQGYVGGIIDRRTGNSFTGEAFGSLFGSGPTTVISTNATTNRFAANFVLSNFDAAGGTPSSYSLIFGNPQGALGAASAFVNDLIFASRDARNTAGNPMSTFGSGSAVSFNRLFMMPNSVAQINLSSFAGPISQCVCEFMQWGWWIGEVQATTSSPRDRFQLATWVTGVLPSVADVQAISAPSVSYHGHMVGNVAVNGGAGGGGYTYVAAGNFGMTWNFATRNGTVGVNGWDRGGPFGANGVTMSGTASSANARDFSGGISGGGLSGAWAGSFFRSPADVVAYLGGNFHVVGSGYRAAGIFAGQR